MTDGGTTKGADRPNTLRALKGRNNGPVPFDFTADQQGRIWLERLPGYAPDLNPVEWLWQHLKHVELRNLIVRDLEELHFEFHLAVGRIRYKHHLIQSFFHDALLD